MKSRVDLIIEELCKSNEKDKRVTINGSRVVRESLETKKKVDDEDYQKKIESELDRRAKFRSEDSIQAKTEEGEKIAKRNIIYAKKGYLKDLDRFKLNSLSGRVQFVGSDRGEFKRAVSIYISSNNKKAFKSATKKSLVTVLKDMGFEHYDSSGTVWWKYYPEDDKD